MLLVRDRAGVEARAFVGVRIEADQRAVRTESSPLRPNAVPTAHVDRVNRATQQRSHRPQTSCVNGRTEYGGHA